MKLAISNSLREIIFLFFKNKEILFLLQNRLPLLYCHTVLLSLLKIDSTVILFLQSFLIKSLSLTVRVFKDAVVVSDVSAHELDILRYIGLRGTHFGRPQLPEHWSTVRHRETFSPSGSTGDTQRERSQG